MEGGREGGREGRREGELGEKDNIFCLFKLIIRASNILILNGEEKGRVDGITNAINACSRLLISASLDPPSPSQPTSLPSYSQFNHRSWFRSLIPGSANLNNANN